LLELFPRQLESFYANDIEIIESCRFDQFIDNLDRCFIDHQDTSFEFELSELVDQFGPGAFK